MRARNGADLAPAVAGNEVPKTTDDSGLLAQKSQSRKAREAAAATATIERLAATFPKAFFVFEGRRKPLQVGIRNDIIAKIVIETRELNRALRFYTRNVGYLRGLRAGVARIDLDGNPIGTVTAEQAQAAAEEIKRRRAKTSAAGNGATPRVSTTPRPPRITLSDLRAAAARRRQQSGAAS